MLCPNIIAEKVSGDRQNFCVQKVSFGHNVRALRRPVSDTSEAEALVAQSGEYMRPLGSLKGNTIGSSQALRDESRPIMLIVHFYTVPLVVATSQLGQLSAKPGARSY